MQWNKDCRKTMASACFLDGRISFFQVFVLLLPIPLIFFHHFHSSEQTSIYLSPEILLKIMVVNCAAEHL